MLGYLTLHGFNCAQAPSSHIVQGRSASGRNGGVRKTTSSNIDCHARFCTFLCCYLYVCMRQCNKLLWQTTAAFSCLRAVQFCTRLTGPHAASCGVGLFAIHGRVSSNCTYTYRSRWGRATCLSNWAQGLNMERLRAQAPWRSHTQTP